MNEGYHVVVLGPHTSTAGEVTRIGNDRLVVALQDERALEALSPGQPVTVRFARALGELSQLRGKALEWSAAVRSGKQVTEVLIAIDGSASGGRRFPIAEFYQPAASAPCPSFPGESIHFRVAAIGREGLTLVTPASDKALLPGMTLSLRVCLPSQAHEVRVTVERVARNEGAAFDEVFVALARTSEAFLEGAGALLMASGGASLRALREAGFALESIDEELSFGYVESEREMQEVLDLRLVAYQSKGKRMHATAPDDMRDRFDALSRHVTCRIGGKLVASARVTFNGGDLGRSEYASYGVDFPDWVRAAPFVEVGRVTTHPDYRGSHIVFRLMQELARIAIETGARYVIGSASDAIKLYERVGFRKAGIQYSAHGMQGVEVIYLDVHAIFARLQGLDFMTWNLVALPILDKIEHRQDPGKLLAIGLFERLKIMGHRAVHPMIKKIAARQRHKPAKKPAPVLAPRFS